MNLRKAAITPLNTTPKTVSTLSDISINLDENTPVKLTRRAKKPSTKSVIKKPDVSSDTIKRNAHFNSWADYQKVYEAFRIEQCQPFRVGSSENNYDLLTKKRDKECPKRFAVYHCICHGKPRARGLGIRTAQKYLATGCQAYIRVVQVQHTKAYKITRCELNHNHELRPELLDRKLAKKALPCRTYNTVVKSEGLSGRPNGGRDADIQAQLDAQWRINTSTNFPAFKRELVKKPIEDSNADDKENIQSIPTRRFSQEDAMRLFREHQSRTDEEATTRDWIDIMVAGLIEDANNCSLTDLDDLIKKLQPSVDLALDIKAKMGPATGY